MKLRDVLVIALIAAGSVSWVASHTRADDSRAATQPANAAKDKPLAMFQRLVGTWRGDAHWSNNELLRTRVSYEYGVGEQVLKSKSFVIDDKGQATLVFESFIYFHPRDKAIRFVSISNGGGVYDGAVSGTMDVLTFLWSAFMQDRKTDYKQTLKFAGDDAYQWTVWQKAADGTWKQIIDAELKRESATAASAQRR
jgi:hypothetical protein